MRGGPGENGAAGSVKELDDFDSAMYCQATLPLADGEGEMTTSTREEIRIGQLAIRFLVEGDESGGTVALFEFDVPAGARVPVAHSHDAYEETIYGLRGALTWTIDGIPAEVGPGE